MWCLLFPPALEWTVFPGMSYFGIALSVLVFFSFVFLEECTCYSVFILEKARLERQTGILGFEGAHSTVAGWPVLPPQISFALVLERFSSSRRAKLTSAGFIGAFRHYLRYFGLKMRIIRMINHIVNSVFVVFEKTTQDLEEKSDFSWWALLYEVLCGSLVSYTRCITLVIKE